MENKATIVPMPNSEQMFNKTMRDIDTRLKKLKGNIVEVLIPTIDQRMDAGQAQALLAEQLGLAKYGIHLRMQYAADSLIQRNRNLLIHRALKGPAQWFFWLDSDVRFAPGAIAMLLGMNKFLIGGGYPIKEYEPGRLKMALEQGVDIQHLLKYGTRNVVSNTKPRTTMGHTYEPIEVDNLGTGFLLTHRSVYYKLKPLIEANKCVVPGQPFSKLEDAEFYYPYFHCDFRKLKFFDGVEVQELMSEDYYFCEKLRETGIKSYVMPAVQLKHVGPHVFEGDYIRSLGLVYDSEKAK